MSIFQIIQLDNGRYVILNILGGYVNKDGVTQTFKSVKSAQKRIATFDKAMSRVLSNLAGK